MDAVKLVGVLLLVALSVGVLGSAVATLVDGADMLGTGFGNLNEGWEQTAGQQPSSPFKIAAVLLDGVLFRADGIGGRSSFAYLAGAIAALASVTLGIFGLKLAFRVWGS